MPIEIRIDAPKGIVHTTIAGSPGTDEIIEALTRVFESGDFRSGMNGIVDMRESALSSAPVDVRRIAEFFVAHRDALGPSRSAVIVSKDVTFGMTRMFQVYGEQSGLEVRIFRDADEARAWIEGSG